MEHLKQTIGPSLAFASVSVAVVFVAFVVCCVLYIVYRFMIDFKSVGAGLFLLFLAIFIGSVIFSNMP